MWFGGAWFGWWRVVMDRVRGRMPPGGHMDGALYVASLVLTAAVSFGLGWWSRGEPQPWSPAPKGKRRTAEPPK
jgi:hypothetical protein